MFFNDDRLLGRPLGTFSSGVGGTERVGRDGVLDLIERVSNSSTGESSGSRNSSTSSSPKSGIGGKGGLFGVLLRTGLEFSLHSSLLAKVIAS